MQKNAKSNSRFFNFLIKFFFIIILYLILFKSDLSNNYNIYRLCVKCTHNLDNLAPKCNECPYEYIFRDFNIATTDDTLNEIIYHNKSIARFGDGEFKLIFGRRGVGFQESNKKLIVKLNEVLNSNEKNLLIAINLPYQKKKLMTYTKKRALFFSNWFKRDKFKIFKILNKSKKYYSSRISRFYIGIKNKSNVPKFVKKLKKIWEGRDVVIVEGEKTRAGVRNDLFNNSKSIKRILCPSINAFNIYSKILNSVLKVNKTNLILIALGPTATILAYDLSKYGYQAIDIGHIDIEYELYLRNATEMIRIPYKFVNEVKYGRRNIQEVKDINYYNQIIDIVLF